MMTLYHRVFYKNKASHLRSFIKGGHTTVREHMPKSHQKYAEWSPHDALITRALSYRSCLGILQLGKPYGDKRLEAACGRALRAVHGIFLIVP